MITRSSRSARRPTSGTRPAPRSPPTSATSTPAGPGSSNAGCRSSRTAGASPTRSSTSKNSWPVATRASDGRRLHILSGLPKDEDSNNILRCFRNGRSFDAGMGGPCSDRRQAHDKPTCQTSTAKTIIGPAPRPRLRPRWLSDIEELGSTSR